MFSRQKSFSGNKKTAEGKTMEEETKQQSDEKAYSKILS